MMSNLDILNVYKNVAQISDGMLHAAQDRDWELLGKLEQDCSAQVESLRQHESQTDTSPELKAEKIRMIKMILANDKAIREITEPWMAELTMLLKSNRSNRQLSQAYGNGSGF